MRVPLSWLRELVDLPADAGGRDVAERLVRAGLEVESVERVGGVDGPLVVGRVLSAVAETASNGKTVRWCQVDVGEPEPRGIVCGAPNVDAGQSVVVALPGAVLPGGFAIAARRTYGHVSDGMVCSERELGLGDDHDGILVLDGAPAPGSPAAPLLGLGDEVLDIAVTPDRGYCFAMRGIAREAATAYAVDLRDPAQLPLDDAGEGAWPVRLEDAACDRFVARVVEGLDPAATTPDWMAARLRASGMRPISVVVDVTNYVMLELGQPIHAYDADRVSGALVARRAGEGARLRTLDGAERALDPEDLVIADDTGPLGVAGVMGGESSEVGAATTRVVVEAAHFDPVVVARAARRHRLPSEASRRFERGVDPRLPEVAAQRVVDLLVAHAGGRAAPGTTLTGSPPPPTRVELDPAYVTARGGVELAPDEVRLRLEQVGCRVADETVPWTVEAPSWRPDLRDPADLVEEVLRLVGYAAVPSLLPRSVPGRGLTAGQRRRRAVGRALAEAGAVEVLSYPFLAEAELDALRLPTQDPRRRAVRLANPMSAEQPLLRTTLLPGLLAAAQRNLGRGATDLALFEVGRVFRELDEPVPAPRPPVDARPGDAQLAAIAAALPRQPWNVAAVLAGRCEPAGWWGTGRAADWADAVELAVAVASAAGVALEVRAGDAAPWHPGRCAELLVGDAAVGWAGELHPGVVAGLRLPPRSVAVELDLDSLPDAGPIRAQPVSGFPVATVDVALAVPVEVPAADVEAALRRGAGPLLEDVRLFDVYTGDQLPPGVRSLAFGLRLRAPDRTLSAAEVAAARDAAVAASGELGAVLRS